MPSKWLARIGRNWENRLYHSNFPELPFINCCCDCISKPRSHHAVIWLAHSELQWSFPAGWVHRICYDVHLKLVDQCIHMRQIWLTQWYSFKDEGSMLKSCFSAFSRVGVNNLFGSRERDEIKVQILYSSFSFYYPYLTFTRFLLSCFLILCGC